MNMNENTHYTNNHGKQLRDFILVNDPLQWEHACNWSAIKYYIRAGKKAGESKDKDLKKCSDYLSELVMIDPIQYDKKAMWEQLSIIKSEFDRWEG